ncbi:hypothetical protein DYB30_013069, partial [Aphanomyces astaci]
MVESQDALRRASSKRLRDPTQPEGSSREVTKAAPANDVKPMSKRALQWRADREWRDAGVDAVDLAVMLETLALERLDSSRRFADREATLVDVKNAELRLQQDEESKSNGMRSQLHHCASQMLVSKFEAYLVEQEFMLIPTVLGKKLVYNAFKAVFVRWVEWTQLTLATNAMTRQFRT